MCGASRSCGRSSSGRDARGRAVLSRSDLSRLACPDCLGALSTRGPKGEPIARRAELECARCGALWPALDGLPRLYREAEVRGNDRLLRHIYDALPSLHDPAVRYLLALFQAGSERALRDGYMPRLELSSLRLREDGSPPRILEVGIGTGANLPLLRRDLPRGLPVEIWGLDLSVGMVEVCRRRLAREGERAVRLVLGDAHALPFPDHSFDRVFHVGAAGSFRDPARALAEMARVSVPGAPIVVVDEQLDPSRPLPLVQRGLFRLVTFYEARPHCPLEHVPPGATDVVEEQISRFFYCLRFRAPGAATRSAGRGEG